MIEIVNQPQKLKKNVQDCDCKVYDHVPSKDKQFNKSPVQAAKYKI